MLQLHHISICKLDWVRLVVRVLHRWRLVIINLDLVRLDILRLWLDRRWGGVILLDWGRLVAKILHRGRLVIIILDWVKLVVMRLQLAVVVCPKACGEVSELVGRAGF